MKSGILKTTGSADDGTGTSPKAGSWPGENTTHSSEEFAAQPFKGSLGNSGEHHYPPPLAAVPLVWDFALRSRQPDAQDEPLMQYETKIGALTMADESLKATIEKPERTHHFPVRKSKRRAKPCAVLGAILWSGAGAAYLEDPAFGVSCLTPT